MQNILKNKLVLPVAALAIVGVLGASYTMAHSGATTANAQTAVVNSNTQVGKDKETQDDNVSPKPSQVVKGKTDTTENDKADARGSTNEVEDGN